MGGARGQADGGRSRRDPGCVVFPNRTHCFRVGKLDSAGEEIPLPSRVFCVSVRGASWRHTQLPSTWRAEREI